MLQKEFNNYFVNDLLYKDTKIIFILESPHTQEVKNGYPVAGKSGNDMSKVLFGLDESFGKLIYERQMDAIGIVNVSNYPLQQSAYVGTPPPVSEFFDKIRQNPKPRKRGAEDLNLVINKMLSNFKNRLEVHKDKKIVICGNFAQSAFNCVFNDDEFSSVIRVPHPSFNNWKKEKYKESIEKLKRFVK